MTLTVVITPEELFAIHNLDPVFGRKPSIDAYVAVRKYTSHTQAVEIAQAGNIQPSSYITCLEYGDATHDEIIQVATVNLKGRPVHGALCRGYSSFDLMVEEYLGYGRGISLRVAVIAEARGIRCRSSHFGKPSPTLTEMLQRVTIEEIVDAYDKLPHNRCEHWLRKLIATGIG